MLHKDNVIFVINHQSLFITKLFCSLKIYVKKLYYVISLSPQKLAQYQYWSYWVQLEHHLDLTKCTQSSAPLPLSG